MELTTSNNKDVYQIITNEIITLLKKDIIPWRRFWVNRNFPVNLITKKPYRAVNFFLLDSLKYYENYYLTRRQINEIGAQVEEGKNPYPVVFQKKTGLCLSYVFNVNQCAGLPAGIVPPETESRRMIYSCGVIIRNPRSRQEYCYDGNSLNVVWGDPLDCVRVDFPSRLRILPRNEKEEIQWDNFSLEEMTAEITSGYLKSLAGVEAQRCVNDSAYISAWIRKLESDKHFIIRAGFQAQKAVDVIFGKKTREPP
ncbi:MAG: DUF1738 domain-containing protein [Bacteroidetes bacterium]|nr:DUF1738 domain-containing protein [Bacteroidota bacterium]